MTHLLPREKVGHDGRLGGNLEVAMDTSLPKIDPERLASQTEWLRRLARRLVRDHDLAEDVVQETLLVALQRPPREASTESGLRAWLRGVAQNLVRMSRRSDGRRAARESTYATHRGSVEPAVDDVVQRAMQARRLVDAVLSLDEPYRSAVLLAYEVQLPAAAIAKRTNVSPETARKRVSRGVAQLRALLAKQDEKDGTAWLSGMAVLCHQPSISPFVWAGGLTVSTKTTAAVAAGALLLLVGAWSLWDDEAPALVLEDSVAEATSASPSIPRDAVVQAPVTSADTSRRVAISASGTTSARTEETIRGRFLLSDDVTPVVGARIRLADAEQTQSVAAASGEVLAETDAQGLFEFTISEDAPEDHLAPGLWAEHDDVFDVHVAATELSLAKGALVEIRTVPLGTVTVHVRDADGQPLEGIAVQYMLDPTIGSDAQLWGHRRDVPAGTSDANGVVRVTGLPVAMEVSFGVQDDWMKPARTVIDPQTRETEVVLTPPTWASIRGRLEWPDGTPATGVRIEWHGTPTRSGWVDGRALVDEHSAGDFEIEGLGSGGGVLLFEGDGSHAPVHLRLERGATVDVGTLVVDRRVVVDGLVVAAEGQDHSEGLSVVAFRDGTLVGVAKTEGEEGRFSLSVPRGPIVLAVVTRMNWDPEMPYRGESLAERSVVAPQSGVELVLFSSSTVVKGRIEAVQGAATVSFFDAEPSVDWGRPSARSGGIKNVTLNEFGAFSCSTTDTGAVRVLVRLEDDRTAYSSEVEIVPGEEVDLGLLDVGLGRLIAKISDEESPDSSDISVTVSNAADVEQVKRSDDDGVVTLELAAGPYAIRADSHGRTSGAWQCVHIDAGSEREMNLAVTNHGLLTGIVESPHGPVAGVTITTQREDPPTNLSWSATSDRDGSFEFQPLMPGTYRYWISGELVGRVVLTPGEPSALNLKVNQPTAIVELRRAGEPLNWARSMKVTSFDQRPHTWRLAKPSEDGRFEVLLPEGPLLFQIDLEGLGNNQIVLVPGPERGGSTYPLELPTTGIELRLEGPAAHRPNPAAYFEELGDLPALTSWGPNSEVYAEEGFDGSDLPYRVLRFPFLAPSTKVSINGITDGGGRVSREVSVEPSGWTIVRWQ